MLLHIGEELQMNIRCTSLKELMHISSKNGRLACLHHWYYSAMPISVSSPPLIRFWCHCNSTLNSSTSVICAIRQNPGKRGSSSTPPHHLDRHVLHIYNVPIWEASVATCGTVHISGTRPLHFGDKHQLCLRHV